MVKYFRSLPLSLWCDDNVQEVKEAKNDGLWKPIIFLSSDLW